MVNLVLTPQPAFLYQTQERDLIKEVLRDRRSPNTKRCYERTLIEFFRFCTGADPTPHSVNAYVHLDYIKAFEIAVAFKASLIERKLAEATVNNRMAAVRSLVKHAQTAGVCLWNLDGILSEKVLKYRDTTGIKVEEYKLMLKVPDRSTLKGKRDNAMLRVLWEILLRRAEICSPNLEDFQAEQSCLLILGKGKGTQKVKMDLTQGTVAAVQKWLEARSEMIGSLPYAPLFIALDRAHFGNRITGSGIYYVVNKIAKQAGLTVHFTPHKIRHSGTTALLDANNGNVREAQRVTRHAKLDTLIMYDDNRKQLQKQGTELLGSLLDN